MSGGVTSALLGSIGLRLVNTVFVTFVVTGGLLMAPVSCMCGASIPHGHSLFQLPFHNHASVDHAAHEARTHVVHQRPGNALPSLMIPDVECGNGASESHFSTEEFSSIARSNAMEKNDDVSLQAPPNSSVGQPIAVTQPTLITLPGQQCELITLPPARVMEGLEPSPEIPPPRSVAIA